MADVEGIGDRSSFRRWDLAWDHFERSGDDRDLEEAIQIARRAVEIASGGSGEEAAALSNLGAALLRRSERTGQSADLGEATEVLRRAVEIASGGSGEEAAALSNLGAALLRRSERTGQSADLDEATEVLRRAVSVAPSSGPQRDAVISSLGDALRRRIEGARDPSAAGQTEQFRRFVAETAFVYEEVVAARTRTLGADHPDTLASMNNLAAVLQDQGELEAARQLHERVLTTVRRVLGEDHLSTLASLNNLAAVLQDQGDLVGARSLYEQVLEARRRVLGADHPSVLASMNNLATVLQDQGDLVGARSLYEQVIEARRRVLGADHPSVLASMNNLATVLQDQGDTETAKTLQARVLATMVAEQAVEGGVMAALSAAAESSSAQAGLGKPQKERYEPAQPPTTALALRSPDEYDLVIQRVQEGDAAAWQELMERYNPLVIVVAHRYSLAPADIEDVMQTVWLLLFEQIRQHRSPEELPGWLATVTRRECLRHLRAKGNTPSSLPDEVEQPAKSAWSDEVAELVELDMQRAAVRDAFQRLAPSCQQLLALLLEEPSRSYQEISSSLGMPIGSIGPRRARCLDHLRRLIQAGGA
jgi:RNA polymerase sigma factor (sigma-70 family)